jgi:hypothetical protein
MKKLLTLRICSLEICIKGKNVVRIDSIWSEIADHIGGILSFL